MSRLPLRNIDDAPAEAQPRLEAALKTNGFLPNLIRLLANAPVALETYQTVSGINARASLTLAALEAVLGVSLATLCNFANNLGQSALNPELSAYEWKGAAAVK